MYACNVATQLGETEGYDLADHVEALLAHTQPDLVDLVLANDRFNGEEAPWPADAVKPRWPPAVDPVPHLATDGVASPTTRITTTRSGSRRRSSARSSATGAARSAGAVGARHRLTRRVAAPDRDLVLALRAELAGIDPSRECDREAERAGLEPAARWRDATLARLGVRLARRDGGSDTAPRDRARPAVRLGGSAGPLPDGLARGASWRAAR